MATDKALGILGTVADLAGLATKIGTSVPGLKKAKRRHTSQQAARAAGQAAQAGAVGGSQTGHGATRGLALREGLRAASGAAREGGRAQSLAAVADERTHIAERDARSARLAQFGNDAAAMAAQTSQGIVDVIAAKEAAGEPIDFEEGGLGVDPDTGLSTVQDPTAQALASGAPLLQDPDELDAGQGGAAGEQTQDFGLGDDLGIQPTTPLQAYQHAMGVDMESLVEIAPVMEYKMRVVNLAAQEAERRGVDISTIVAPLFRKLNIDPEMMLNAGLQGSEQEGQHQDTMDMMGSKGQ